MRSEIDREVYGLIVRLGRSTLRGFVAQAMAMIERQAAGTSPGRVFEVEGTRSATFDEINRHPALREYRRLIWLGWRIDYDHTPQCFMPGVRVALVRGRRTRFLAIERD